MNSKMSQFNEFLVSQSVQIPVLTFVLNLLLAAILGYILSRVYIKYGNALSNRNRFAANFVIMSMTTMVIITIVKSSLALSLGLVGALSIVRFRAAIKDPEELSYLFLTIAIGLGLGADQTLITLIGFTATVAIIAIKSIKKEKINFQNIFLTFSSKKSKSIDFSHITEILKRHCSGINLRRLDEADDDVEVTYAIDIDSVENFEKIRRDVHEHNRDINITLLDNRGID